MGQHIITEIEKDYTTFKYNSQCNFIENLKFKDDTNIDELIGIRYLLDTNNINYKIYPTFDIRILQI